MARVNAAMIVGFIVVASAVMWGYSTIIQTKESPPYSIAGSIGCPSGMVEDMSIGQCIRKKWYSVDMDRVESAYGDEYLDAVLHTNPKRQRKLADAFLNGDENGNDIEAAAELYRLASLNGDTIAQFSYANMLARGMGVEQDTLESLKWLREAALNGHAMAQMMWGAILVKGVEVEKDEAEGSNWIVRGMTKLSEEDRDFDPAFLGT